MKTIPGFSNYAISTGGRVWSKPRMDKQNRLVGSQYLRAFKRKTGHLIVRLYHNEQQFDVLVHRLVLEAYVGPCPEGKECRHLNGNPSDNQVKNLKWGTSSENQQDSVRHGTCAALYRRGEKHPLSKLKESDVRVIRYLRKVAKFTLADLAWQFDIGINTVWNICTGRTWGHLDGKI